MIQTKNGKPHTTVDFLLNFWVVWFIKKGPENDPDKKWKTAYHGGLFTQFLGRLVHQKGVKKYADHA